MINQGFELGKDKNTSIISRAYMSHYIRHPHLLGGALSARYYGMHDLYSVHVSILYMYSIPLYSYFIIMLETLEREICLSQNTGTVWSNQVN